MKARISPSRPDPDGSYAPSKVSPSYRFTAASSSLDSTSAPTHRVTALGDAARNIKLGYPKNVVITSKYTAVTFVPKNLFEQFRRVANVYFLIISLLQLLTDLSPTSKYTTALPLFGVLLLSMVKEGVEDLRRHRADTRINNSEAAVLDPSEPRFNTVLWHSISVGSIVRVEEDHEIPADMVVLSTSTTGADICYVDTSNLDGENNLKLRQALKPTASAGTAAALLKLRGTLTYELPNPMLYHFLGSLQMDGEEEATPISNDHLLLRGTVLKNTRFVFGLVVYTGPDSKASLNARSAPSKTSAVDRAVNRAILLIFGTLFIMCSIGMVANQLWVTEHAEARQYLTFVNGTAATSPLEGVIQAFPVWVTDLILYNNLVPISLYVSLELVRWHQARQIDNDVEMYHAETDTPARARTSNLNEDLGKVEYVFSDKTGTLTRNEMVFRKCSIAGTAYGFDVNSTLMSDDVADEESKLLAGADPSASDDSATQHRAGAPSARNAAPPATTSLKNSDPRLLGSGATPISESGSREGPPVIHEALGEEEGASASGMPQAAALSRKDGPLSPNTLISGGVSSRGQSIGALQSRASAGVATSVGGSVVSPFSHTFSPDGGPGSRDASTATYATDPGFKFDDPRLLAELRAGGPKSEAIHEFLLCLAICHSVIPTRKRQQGGSEKGLSAAPTPASCDEVDTIVYQASSPDEAALVLAAKCLGFYFKSRSGDTITVRIFDEDVQFKVLAINEFTSTRKRMSVLVERPDGQHVLYCKGADSVILPRLDKQQAKPGGHARTHHASEVSTAPGIAHLHVSRGFPEEKQLRPAEPATQAAAVRGGAGGASGTSGADDERVTAGSAAVTDGAPPQDANGGAAILDSGKDSPVLGGVTPIGSVEGSHKASMTSLASSKTSITSKASHNSMISVGRENDIDLRVLDDHLSMFASEGLRTLVLGSREVDAAFVEEWLEVYNAAANALSKRGTALTNAAALIEQDLKVLGASAIEDKLQAGAADTISSLADGGIKIWMLTGDKEETAINIARSCRLLKDDMHLVFVNQKDEAACRQAISAARGELRSRAMWHPGHVNDFLALVVDGDALSAIMPTDMEAVEAEYRNSRVHPVDKVTGKPVNPEDPDFDPKTSYLPRPVHLELLELAHQCKAVVACRVSPLQKSQVVRLVKTRVTPQPMTLSIGDGANDVSMLQEADVGVGVSGREGMQAVRASDYSIAQFRFLKRLLLVHGRWNQRRTAKVILYSFYKNIAMVLTLFFFGFYNGASGTTLYESWLGAGWNVGWTFLPILFVGINDRDLKDSTALQIPLVYEFQKSKFSALSLSCWVLNALVHAVIVYFVGCAFFMEFTTDPTGGGDGLWLQGAAVNWALVVVVNLKLCAITATWRRNNIYALLLSVLAWPAFVLVYSMMFGLIGRFSEFADVGPQLFSRPAFWFLAPLCGVAAMSIDVAVEHIRRMRFPGVTDLVQEWDRGFGTQLSGADLVDILKSLRPRDRRTRQYEKRRAIELAERRGSVATKARLVAEREFEHVLKQLLRLREQVAARAGEQIATEQFDLELYSQSMQPITHTFLGHPSLEAEYSQGFYVAQSLRLTRVTIVTALILGVLYLGVEILGTAKAVNIVIRCGLLVGGAVLLWYTYSPSFANHFQTTIASVVLLGGLGTTLIIDDGGEFGQTLFHLLVFQVLRIRFVNAVGVSFVDLVFFAVYSALNTPVNLPVFIIYLAFILGFVAYGSHSQQLAMRHDFLQQRALISEKQRSEEVLASMMPPHVTQVVRTSRAGTQVISYDEADVTILFCDIVDFSEIAAKYSPKQLVQLMDHIYSLFDEICRKHGITKIETVGKTYMACAGLQADRRDHASAVVGMGLDMIRIIASCQAAPGRPALEIRIGVHTGSLVAGVVGRKKPQFCLFGDTVNTSSRMQSTGEPMRVHVSPHTYERIKGVYATQPRTVWVKGKGDMTTHLVVGKKGRSSSSSAGGSRSLTRTPSGSTRRMMKAMEMAAVLEQTEVERSSVYGSQPETIVEGEASNRTLVDAREIQERNEKNRRHLKALEASRRKGLTVDIAQFTLRFAPRREHDYLLANSERFRSNLRSTLIILTLFHLFRLLTAVLHQESADLSDRELISRVSFIGVALAVALLASAKFWPSSPVVNTTVACVLLTCGGICLAIADGVARDVGLDLLFFFALAANGGTLIFLASTSIILFVGIVSIVLTGVLPQYDDDEEGLTFTIAFFVGVALVFNLISSWNTEYYLRRRFGLLDLTLRETENTNQMLYAMLPKSLITQLKSGRTLISDSFSGVSILFCDIVHFTSMSSRIKPSQVVTLLNKLFTSFDILTDKYGAFKVQTIGDAYVMVVGLPYSDTSSALPTTKSMMHAANAAAYLNDLSASRRLGDSSLRVREDDGDSPRQYALQLVALAFEMLERVKLVKDPSTGRSIQMRIGIHTGSVVSGIIGTKSLRFDMWGTDVLCANLMESNSKAGRILLSETTHGLLRNEEEFNFDEHSPVEVNGMGSVRTFLISPKSSAMLRSAQMRSRSNISDTELEETGVGRR